MSTLENRLLNHFYLVLLTNLIYKITCLYLIHIVADKSTLDLCYKQSTMVGKHLKRRGVVDEFR